MNKDLLKCITAYNEYGGYCIPKSSEHCPAAQTVINGNVYEPDTISYLLDETEDGDIIHAGAFYGDFIPALSQKFKHVWAFEPNYENYRCSRVTVEINNIKNVSLFNSGLSNEKGEVYLRNMEPNGNALGGGSMLLPKGEKNIPWDYVEKVRVVPVGKIVPPSRHVSAIQLDVEGHEKNALQGAIDIIERCKPVIIVEVWSNNNVLNSEWLKENIFPLGYEVVKEVHDNKVLRVK